MDRRDAAMRLKSAEPGEIRDEFGVCAEMIDLASARVLELGCGKAEATRKLAQAHPAARFTALENDTVQATLNLQDANDGNLSFGFGAAEAIPADAGAFDAVLMFKSLHHVAVDRLDAALAEIHRVLAAGGSAFFCEPVFDGEYNEVLRIFHDEERVRAAAFDAIRRAVAGGRFELVEERFFRRAVSFASFAHFEKAVIGVTHTHHRLTPDQFARVRERFMRSSSPDGAHFLSPMRADLLRKA